MHIVDYTSSINLIMDAAQKRTELMEQDSIDTRTAERLELMAYERLEAAHHALPLDPQTNSTKHALTQHLIQQHMQKDMKGETDTPEGDYWDT